MTGKEAKIILEQTQMQLETYRAANRQLMKEITDMKIEIAKLKKELSRYQSKQDPKK